MGHLLSGERHLLREDHLARLRVGDPVHLGWCRQATVLIVLTMR